MNILKMEPCHLKEVSDIENMSFSHPWSYESFESELEKSDSLCYVAIDNDRVTGYIIVNCIVDEMYLLDIATHPGYRRQGVARRLFDKVLKTAADNRISFITLEVRKSNASAISLYTSLGFETVAVRSGYYSNPNEDAVLMSRYF